MVLDGQGQVTIDGGGKGTVLSVEADGAIIRNLHLTGSGRSHDQVDAAVEISADHVLLSNNVIDEVLFGVHISQGNGNVVRGNRIRSYPGPATLRGDGIRLWYSRENRIECNAITQVRDLVFTNSPDNLLRDNHISDSRMGVELIFSPKIEVVGNRFSRNDHGIVGVYSDELHIHRNRIEHQANLLGSAIAVKGSSQTVIESNEILDCAVGLTANSPTFPENLLFIIDNHFAYNDVALYFYGEKGGHVVHGNIFEGNFQEVAVTSSTSALSNDWLGNSWQNYSGFDRDGDGVGDTPFSVVLYSERIWMERGMARYFRGTPALQLVDFVERLVPFSEPEIILEDPKPMMRVSD